MQCGEGVYSLTIKKPKYRTWHDTVEVVYGVESKLSPVFLSKSSKHNTYLLLKGALAMNPSWSAGLMLGQTYGEVSSKIGTGCYLKARSNFQFQKNTSGLVAGEGGKVNGELLYYKE